MKKCISFILCFAMIFTMVFSVYATNFTDTKNHSNEKAIRVLSDLGIVKGIDEGVYAPDKTLTRAELTAIIIRALGYEKYIDARGSETKFIDVEKSHWASGYIDFASDLNIIKGYGDERFGPEDAVTNEQMITIIVRALGYGYDVIGSYPAGYINKALSLNILDKISMDNQPATRGEMAQLIYNSLNCGIAKVDGKYNTYVNEKDTILNRVGASIETDVIDYNEAKTLNDITKVGTYAEMYKNGNGKVISFSTLANSVNGIYTGSKIDGFAFKTGAFDTTKYFINAKEVKAFPLVSGYYYYLNCETDGNYITKIYSVSAWIPKTMFQMTDKDFVNNTLHGYNFVLTSTDQIDTSSYYTTGSNSLEVGNIVTLYTYGNEKSNIVRLSVCSDVVTGTVDKIKTSNGIVEYTINGKTYTSFVPLITGVEYKCYLNTFGKIFTAEVIKNTNVNYGIYSTYKIDNFSELKIGIHTFDKPSVISAFVVTNKVNVKFIAPGTLVSYTTDKDGIIDSLCPSIVSYNTVIKNSIIKINGKDYTISKDVKVFTTDVKGNISTSTIKKVKKNVNIGTVSVVLNDSKEVVAVLVNPIFANETTDSAYAVINDISYVFTKDGKTTAIEGYIDGVATDEALCSSAITTLGINPNLSILYKIDYLDDVIKSVTPALHPTYTYFIKNVKDNFIYDTYNNIYELSDDAIVYKWDKSFTKVDKVEKNKFAILYDTNNDKLYDIVIYANKLNLM